MNPADSLPIEQHNTEIHRNREAWARKPGLRAAYGRFYEHIRAQLDRSVPGAVVELGSGIGTAKTFIPDCVTTDLFADPWIDRQENAYRLSFGNETVSHLVLFDVWHHLRYPGTALAEFHRVLAPGGRLILFEPAASWLGRVVYGLFHHEPVGMGQPITWLAPADFTPDRIDYYAAQGSATRCFWHGEYRDQLAGWRLRTLRPLASFEYLLSGGFSGPQVGGQRLEGLVRRLDGIAQRFPRLFAARLLVVLEKERRS